MLEAEATVVGGTRKISVWENLVLAWGIFGCYESDPCRESRHSPPVFPNLVV